MMDRERSLQEHTYRAAIDIVCIYVLQLCHSCIVHIYSMYSTNMVTLSVLSMLLLCTVLPLLYYRVVAVYAVLAGDAPLPKVLPTDNVVHITEQPQEEEEEECDDTCKVDTDEPHVSDEVEQPIDHNVVFNAMLGKSSPFAGAFEALMRLRRQQAMDTTDEVDE